MDFEKITDNCYALFNGVNTTAFILPSQVVMIDAGARRPPIEMQAVRRQIESLASQPVKTVILTHFHSDHTHSLPFYSDCTIIASTRLAKHLHDAKRKTLPGFPVVAPTKLFEDSLELQEGTVRLVIRRTGGHTDDSSYIFCSKERVLVAGDNLMPGYPWGGKGSSLHQWIRALQEYLTLDLDTIIPGHGPLMTKTFVQDRLAFMLKVQATMQECISQGKSEKEVLAAADAISYQKPLSPQAKPQVLRRWYKNWEHQ
ncbi:MAG: MBL fold metallo-hydrolase [Candidatus Hermodarchaeota archaeon]|nr:MBL fold metallo-hydrolase [Candidatus Hermodarchaeota archaeon]